PVGERRHSGRRAVRLRRRRHGTVRLAGLLAVLGRLAAVSRLLAVTRLAGIVRSGHELLLVRWTRLARCGSPRTFGMGQCRDRMWKRSSCQSQEKAIAPASSIRRDRGEALHHHRPGPSGATIRTPAATNVTGLARNAAPGWPEPRSTNTVVLPHS